MSIAACGSEQADAPTPKADTAERLRLPAAPAALTATRTANRIRATWAPPPDSASPIMSYRMFPDDKDPVTLPASATSYVLAGLEPGSSHIVQVVAVTRAGQGPAARIDVVTAVEKVKPSARRTKKAAAVVGIHEGGSGDATSSAGAAAVPQPSAPALQPTAQTDRVSVSGSLTMATIISRSISDDATCDGRGLRILVKDGAGATVALGKLGSGTASGIKRDHGILDFLCTWQYSADVTLSSPVYTFRAYYEGLEDTIDADESTVSAADLAGGKAPRFYLSFCPGCSTP